MSAEGRVNTIIGIQTLVAAVRDIRETVQRATADGNIDKKEALNIFTELAKACIKEGLIVALGVAQTKANQ